ncbi:shikimate kinase [Parabacteroides sp. Marseille-P3160]|uniref:shikimate kinase n=1 Tax=Parabacteroides sp. Marseille-P3160 TaxID=1917887 RepID=UPI0009B98434|nr:shikimate kinase [Parabacteroides sp. Marseille-P3160]
MKRIFLIGYMGAGKTTVGKILAGRLALSFIDLDHYIESRYHRTIGQLFTEKGEEEFRRIERAMLQEVADFEDVLISTGGGVPCFYDNMEFMNKVGTTVYLKVSVEELAARLEMCKGTRPVLQGRSGEELKGFIARNLGKRTSFYDQATIIYDAEQMDTETDVITISKGLERLLL